ncbi:MAG: lysylphosphatidylglycerol synthase transmembrane domain-containing protein [Flavobacteriales bacterium]|nr:lysylphosphatidylglycerol synthase transmembrane domain-containing protein [Flavobacteriales bacterium]
MALSPQVKKILSISIKFILLPLLALALLYFAFSGMNLRNIWEEIKEANYFYVALSFITGYTAFVLIGLRWLIPLDAMGYSGVSKMNSIHSVTITYIANLAVPRAGEVARCTALNQAEGIPVSKLLGTVILERAIDVIMLGISIFLTIVLQYKQMEAFGYKILTLRQDIPTEPAISYKTIIIIFIVAIAAFIYLFRKKLRHTILYHKIVDFSHGMMEGIKTITRMRRKWAFVYYTILIWLMYYLMIFFMSYAFSQTETLSAANILYLMTVGGLAQLIPVQGGIGAYHTAMKIGIPILGIAAITPDIAMAFATLNHATQTVMQLSTGALAIFFISRAKIKRSEKTENEKENMA